MNQQLAFTLQDPEACQAFGSSLAQMLQPGTCLYLQGNLGVGKTALTQGVLKALGVKGPIKSPSYALVETYELAKLHIAHIDLYRISDPEELEFMGIRDYFNQHFLCIVEWPEKALQLLPDPDLSIQLNIRHRPSRQYSQKAHHHEQLGGDARHNFQESSIQEPSFQEPRTGILKAHSEQTKEQWEIITKRLSQWTSN